MKRATTPDGGSTKRAKVCHPTFFGELPEQCPKDILLHGVDEEKWLTGKFQMVWPATNGIIKALATIHSSTSPNDIVFPILFELGEKYMELLTLSPLTHFRLSLRGAEVCEITDKKHLSTLPIQLMFSKGIHIMWKVHGLGSEIKSLKTWPNTTPTSADNVWYNSDHEDGQKEMGRNLKAPISFGPTTSTVEQIRVDEGVQEVISSEILKANKKRQRREIKRQKKEALANPDISIGIRNVIDPLLEPSSVKIPEPIEVKATTPEPGLRNTPYQPINEIYPGQIAQLSGIITGVSPYVKKTSRDEWMCYIEIADRSSSRSDATGQWKGIKVNCFTKRHKEWLPLLQRGDAVILRDVKIEQYQGHLSGVGYNQRLRWAAYSPTAGEIYYGLPNDAPKSEKLANGFGAEFSPFYEPNELDIQHLISLSDWWRKLAEKDKSDSVAPVQNMRLHRLISQAGPYVAPDGYFDCTVEILKVHIASQGIHSLFVTDYTHSPGSSHSSKSWPTSLNDCVLQIEMWDDAARYAETIMKPGEYYSLKNVRMRIGRGGYIEGKMQQDKITQLDETDSQNDIYLEALLRRKKEWERNEMNTDLDAFQLIQDVEEGRFFDCVVELLHILVLPHRMPCLYVADYSSSTRLSVTGVDQSWSHGLDGRIIQIMLSDEQSSIAHSAVTGTFWSVRNLRIKYNEVERCYCGIIGGGEKLMVPLNVNRTDNVPLNDLLKRKEGWAKTIQNIQQPIVTLTTAFPRSLSGPEIGNKDGDVFLRVRDMPLQNFDSARLRLMAKVVDFYPLELKDAFYQKCSSCKKEIPSNRRACASCEDFEHEFIRYFYQMFILIEDSAGDQIRVSVNDKCPLFAGLKRAHLREDNRALEDFVGRVKPLIKDLTLVHDGLKAGDVTSADMPFLCFELETWVIEEATRAFSLTTFEEVHNV